MSNIKYGAAIFVGAFLFAGTELTLAQTQSSRATSSANAASDKSQFEFDFWKSTERIDSPAAYAAYLETFPNGRFAALARAAMAKGGQVPASKAPVPVLKEPQLVAAPQALSLAAETRSTSEAKLAAYSEETNTGSINLRAGDKLIGPITYAVGGLGAKKQILVPKGEWVVLAATDHAVSVPYLSAQGGLQNIQRVPNTSIVMAQFDGVRAVSLLVFEYSRGAISVRINAWPDAAKCEGSEAASIFLAKEGSFTLQQCAIVNGLMDNRLRESAASDLWKDVDASLSGLHGSLGQFNIESSIFVYNQKSYLRISRFDCTQATADGQGCEPLTELSRQAARKAPNVDRRIAWVKAYLPFAVTGFKRDLDDDYLLKTAQAKTMVPD